MGNLKSFGTWEECFNDKIKNASYGLLPRIAMATNCMAAGDKEEVERHVEIIRKKLAKAEARIEVTTNDYNEIWVNVVYFGERYFCRIDNMWKRFLKELLEAYAVAYVAFIETPVGKDLEASFKVIDEYTASARAIDDFMSNAFGSESYRIKSIEMVGKRVTIECMNGATFQTWV